MNAPWNDLEQNQACRLLKWGLEEDLGSAGDITSAFVIDADRKGSPTLVARKAGVLAGMPALSLIHQVLPPSLRNSTFEISPLRADGPIQEGDTIAHLHGPTRTLLSIERTMLNFLCHLSGIATLTARYVESVHGTKAIICDTRKTTPGWRHLEKYAVRVGGGTNHRIGLFDAVLIKDNHLAELGRHADRPLQLAVQKARQHVAPGIIVEIEVDSLTQLEQALTAQPDIILLDNMCTDNLSIAVEMRSQIQPTVLLEASGGVTLETVHAIAMTGVDRISVGAITHSAPILDLALDDLLP